MARRYGNDRLALSEMAEQYQLPSDLEDDLDALEVEAEELYFAARKVLAFLADGHGCLDCGLGPHRPDCVFVQLRAMTNP